MTQAKVEASFPLMAVMMTVGFVLAVLKMAGVVALSWTAIILIGLAPLIIVVAIASVMALVALVIFAGLAVSKSFGRKR